MKVRPLTFHELYSQYADDLYRFAYWLSGNPHDAKDITSETFVRAWTALDDPEIKTVKAYLFSIARNLYRKQWRHQSRMEDLDEELHDLRLQPDEAVANQEEFHRTLRAVQTLPELDRVLLLLRAEQGMSYEEIAVQTGLSVVTAKVKVFRARAKLAGLLQTKTREKP